MNWEVGTEIGSHDAAVKSSWLALLASALRNPNVRWLSSLDSINAAENKLTQYTYAKAAGSRIPDTIVTNNPASLESLPPLVAKALGPGHYKDPANVWRSVYTESFNPAEPEQVELVRAAPFILQERIEAQAHLRVVTVADSAWAFRLDAADLPIDWREVDAAHDNWVWIRDKQLESDSLRIAAAHNLGYSSQDWIESVRGRYFVDLNPSGQWLFLPDAKARQISHAIADWLGCAP